LRKCSSCSLFMYASPRLVMYGVTLRGPASRLPASGASSASLSFAAVRGAGLSVPIDGTPFAVTTMRSDGGVLRIACATGVAAAGALATGDGLLNAAGFAATVALAATGFAGAGLAALLAATGFVAAGFFAVNLGFSTFFGFAAFAVARLAGIVGRSRPRSDRGPVCRTRDYTGE